MKARRQRCSSTLPLTSALNEGGHFNSGSRPNSHLQEAVWMPGAGLDGCGKSRLHRDSIPGQSNP